MEKFPGNKGVRVLVNRTDGGVSIFYCLTCARLDPSTVGGGWKPINDWFARNVAINNFKWDVEKQGISCVSMKIIEDSEIPTDREFRDAWGHDFVIDMKRAKEIHKENLRRLRAPLLASLDVDFILALGAGDTVEQNKITKRKQELRDITALPGIESAKTVSDLKAITL